MIGNNIKRIRESRGLKQSDLAEIVGVSDKTVSSWEINRTEPKIGMIEKIAVALQCKKSDIIGSETVDHIYKLSSGEEFLVECHRNFDDNSRTRLIAYAKRLKELNTLDSQLLNAAHKRTDIDIPSDADTSEDDIMDDPNF